jgi:hypothetical protein
VHYITGIVTCLDAEEIAFLIREACYMKYKYVQYYPSKLGCIDKTIIVEDASLLNKLNNSQKVDLWKQ